MSSAFVDVAGCGKPVRIEHQWIAAEKRDVPLIVFLHEGLGSLAMWKDFPSALCEAAGARGLVYSRPGYGRSTPRSAAERWSLDFMHHQAYEVLPALLQALDVDAEADRPWLFGHSDGGSIALLYASRYPHRVAGVVAVAPHIMVEDLSVLSIDKTRTAYLETDLRARLAKYHDDADSAFWGWNDVWLNPAFRAWSIQRELAGITAPLLAVQGLADEYGTLEQIRGIARVVPHAQLLELAHSGHSPQRDQPEALISASVAFIQRSTRGD